MLPIPLNIPRAALVTGAAQRIGRAIALALAGAGFDIACIATPAPAAPRRPPPRSASAAAAPSCCAPTSPMKRRPRTLLPRVSEAFGPIGVLVNNASPFERDEWHDATRASWDAHIEPDLRAPFVLMQAFARVLPPEAEGVVINMLDQRVWSLTPHFVSYTVSKAGLWALTQTMALALAPRIRVNAIGPGPALPSPRQTAEQFARQAGVHPAGPWHQPGRDRPRRDRDPVAAVDDRPDDRARRRPAPAMGSPAGTARRREE